MRSALSKVSSYGCEIFACDWAGKTPVSVALQGITCKDATAPSRRPRFAASTHIRSTTSLTSLEGIRAPAYGHRCLLRRWLFQETPFVASSPMPRVHCVQRLIPERRSPL